MYWFRTGLPVLCELDVLLSPLGELLALGSGLEICLYGIGLALAGSDDRFQVSYASAVALRKSGLCGSIVLYENLGESGVEALLAGKLGSGVLIPSVEDIDNGLVGLCGSVAGSGEVLACSSLVTGVECYDTLGVVPVGILLALVESLVSLFELTLVDVNDCEVVLCTVAVVLLDCLLVDGLLVGRLLHESGGAEESLFVEYVDVLVNELDKLLAGVVLVLAVGDEAAAAELRENLVGKSLVNGRHVLDLILTYCRVAVHRKNADDEVLVLDVGSGNKLLEAFPVLTYALDAGLTGLFALGNLVECLLGALCTLVGKLGVELLATVR